MSPLFDALPFRPADLLLPQGCALEKWAVVACDQYASQPEYWSRVDRFVGDAPSALRLILPESCLDGPGAEGDITEVNVAMTRYLRQGRFRALPGALIYTERRLSSGKTRRGLVGAIDLECYDYEPGSSSPIRPTGDVDLARLPLRVAARKNAPLELSHAILLADDPEDTLLSPLAARRDRLEPLYDFQLMEGGGHLRGWLLDPEGQAGTAAALTALMGRGVPLLAVGDGHHSLATAKECHERQKRLTPPELWPTLPSRFAMAELVNIHDDALELRPIHRLLSGVEPRAVLARLLDAFPGAHPGPGAGSVLSFVHRDGSGLLTLPSALFPAAALQDFLDGCARSGGCALSYIHGDEAARTLGARPGCLSLLLPQPDKSTLFPGLLPGGALPRKPFSVGEAWDKRYYLEARRIR